MNTFPILNLLRIWCRDNVGNFHVVRSLLTHSPSGQTSVNTLCGWSLEYATCCPFGRKTIHDLRAAGQRCCKACRKAYEKETRPYQRQFEKEERERAAREAAHA